MLEERADWLEIFKFLFFSGFQSFKYLSGGPQDDKPNSSLERKQDFALTEGKKRLF